MSERDRETGRKKYVSIDQIERAFFPRACKSEAQQAMDPLEDAKRLGDATIQSVRAKLEAMS